MKKQLTKFLVISILGTLIAACGENPQQEKKQKAVKDVLENDSGKEMTPEHKEEMPTTEGISPEQHEADLPDSESIMPEDYDEPVLSGIIAEIFEDHFSIYETETTSNEGSEVAITNTEVEKIKIKIANDTVVVRRRTSYETYESEILSASLEDIQVDTTAGLWGIEKEGEFIATLILLWEFY